MPKREFEGDWVFGWPDRKRATVIAGKDAEGRVINGRAPLVDLEGLITPTDAYYIVNQLEVPEPVHPSDWTLEISGCVERRLTLTLDDLRRLPGRTVRAVTECAGNDAGYFDYLEKGGYKPSRINRQDMQKRATARAERVLPTAEEVSADSTTTCAASAGEFTGVPLFEVLKLAGVKPESVSVRLRGFDRGRPDPAVIYRSVGHTNVEIPDRGIVNYEKALPLEKALHSDTLLAWAQNGEYMLHIHGAPVRLIVPGWSANWWVKWIDQLEIMDHVPSLFYQHDYFIFADSPTDPNKHSITAMGVRCVISEPLDEDSPLLRGSHMVRGRAWSGMGSINRVEVSFDDGATWADAHVEEPREKWLWSRWSFLWEVTVPGAYRILARATDECGRVQPQIPWNYQRKLFDGIVPLEVNIE
jgi:DMSO/TMAO reductase YedYZ molybdopterin-dependent catalytic subunit